MKEENKKIKIFTFRRILALILLPFVSFGLFIVYQNARASKRAYGVGDPLIVTYNGNTPSDPMFNVTNMLPGDEEEKTFNVENGSDEDETVIMSAVKTDEDKDFAGILDLEIEDMSTSTIIISGKLQDLFDSTPINLGNFPAGTDKDFRVKVKFPSSAGNEFQNALVIFNITWITQGPEITIPEGCKEFESGITRVIEGTEGMDFFIGSRENELFILKGGRDIVFGSKGNDIILGGEGDDWLLDGSDGNDCIIGGPGNDRIDGSDDEDLLFGNEGNDYIDGGGNDDIIIAGEGRDFINGGAHNDLIYADGGNDIVEGGSGNDEIHGGPGNDNMNGESGNDKLYGEEGDDILDGSSGTDLLDGGPDSDSCEDGETNLSCEILL